MGKFPSIFFYNLFGFRSKQKNKMGKKVTSKEGMVAEVKKKITEMQFELDKMSDEVDNLNKKLEEERALRETAESEVLALHRKIQLVEEDFDRTEEKLKEVTEKYEESAQADIFSKKPSARRNFHPYSSTISSALEA